jgi:DNA (cytosine-5)-methyltransferase 1
MSKLDKNLIKKFMLEKWISTQIELAKALGISKSQLSNLLSDKFNPIKSNIQEISDFFEVDPIELLKK